MSYEFNQFISDVPTKQVNEFLQYKISVGLFFEKKNSNGLIYQMYGLDQYRFPSEHCGTKKKKKKHCGTKPKT